MGAWKESRELTRRTYDVVKQHKGLTAYPVRAAVHGAIGGAVFAIPAVAVMAVIDTTASAVAGVVLLVLAGLVAASLATMQMGALVADAERVLQGGEPDRAAARAAAAEHRNSLVGWAAANLVVGTLLNAIRGQGQQGGIVVAIASVLLAGALAVAWSVVTFFALPVIILEGLGTIEAIKRSGHLVHHRWGTAIAGGARIGGRFFLMFSLPGILIVALGVVVAIMLDNGVGWGIAALAVVIGLVLMVVGSVLVATCRNVFGVALYHYAADETVVGPFTATELASAVKVKSAA